MAANNATPQTTPETAQGTTSAASPKTQKTYPLGVLFVHGIGEQREGETLAAFGEPLIAWIRDWIAGHGQRAVSEPIRPEHHDALAWLGSTKPDGIEVASAALFPSRRLSTDPAHSVVELRVSHRDSGRGQETQRWLFAESWWGEQVQPPPVFDLLRWLFSRGTFVAFMHTAERAWQFTHPLYPSTAGAWQSMQLKLDKTGWRHGVWLFALLRYLLVASALQFFLLLAWLIALIPLPAVRKYVVAALQIGTRILGDSYGLVANDTQRGAILTRFRHTVDWLDRQCEQLAIIAHSQGAGVVYSALQERVIAPPALLLSFGAGLTKLAQLRQCEVHRRTPLVSAGWIIPTAWIALTLGIWRAWGAGADVTGLNLLVWTFACASLFCAVPAWFAWFNTREQPPAPNDLQFGAASRWIDLYASSDPVPQGPLTTFLPGRGIVSERMINRRSMLADHNAYWTNKTGFVARVVAELDRVAGGLLRVPDLMSSADYQRAREHYHQAIFALSAGWWLALLALVAISLSRFDELATAGKAAIESLQGGPFDTLIASIQAPGALPAWLAGQLAGRVPGYLPSLPSLGYAGVAVAGALIVVYLWHTANTALLTRWGNALLSDFVENPARKTWGKYGAWIAWPYIALVALLPLLFAYFFYVGLSPPREILRLCALLVIAMFALFLGLGFWQQLPKDLKTVLGSLCDVLRDAITPGSDDPNAARRGGASWVGLWRIGASVTIIATIATIALEKLAGVHVKEWILACVVMLAPLLSVRLAMLVKQRGYANALAWLVGLAPWALAALLAVYMPERDGVSTVRWLSSTLIAAMLFAPLVYLVVDRALRPQRSSKQ